MPLRFADCVLDEARHELRRGGELVAIEPQAFRILIALLLFGQNTPPERHVLNKRLAIDG